MTRERLHFPCLFCRPGLEIIDCPAKRNYLLLFQFDIPCHISEVYNLKVKKERGFSTEHFGKGSLRDTPRLCLVGMVEKFYSIEVRILNNITIIFKV